MKLISDSEKKVLLADLLVRVTRFFSKYGISYYLAGGTLLGAVRHKGFIPWDDDIDLHIPRTDFIRFIHIMEEEDRDAVDNWDIVEFDEHKLSYYKKFKIADTRTVMQEYGRERPAVFIDVFPLDGYKYSKFVGLQRKSLLLIDNLAVLFYSRKIENNNVGKKVFYSLMLGVGYVVGHFRIVSILEKLLLSITRLEGAKYIGCTEGSYGLDEIQPAKVFSETIYLEFEGQMFPAYGKYDDYLTQIYGDYMVPPPENKRQNHSYYQMYWKE